MDERSDQSDDPDGPRAGNSLPVLATRRLILREPHIADAEAIAAIANNRKVAEQTRRMPHPYSAADAIQWIEVMKHSGDWAFLVTRKSDKAVVGGAGVGAMNERDREVGYWIGEPYWGNSYATEAVHAVIDFAFASTALEQIYGRCRVVNPASRRVLMKCGFQFVGTGMGDSQTVSGPVPVEEFVLERTVWASLKQWGAE